MEYHHGAVSNLLSRVQSQLPPAAPAPTPPALTHQRQPASHAASTADGSRGTPAAPMPRAVTSSDVCPTLRRWVLREGIVAAVRRFRPGGAGAM